MVVRFVCTILFLLFPVLRSAGVDSNKDGTPIQAMIDDALDKALATHTVRPISDVGKIVNNKKGNVWNYWSAYIQMCVSVYYTSRNNPAAAKNALDKGISLLETGNMNTEDYALLAYMQCQYIRYTNGMRSGILAAKSKSNAKQSVTKDAKNIRGWFVLGVLDYYTPKQFGGKEKTEEYMCKAITLPAQKIKNRYLPSWGRKEIYSILLAYYKELGNKGKLRKYYQMAIKEFPDEVSFKGYGKY